MISLHSHSGQFCRHAKGQLEDVVLEAIRQGFEVYGLSEHIPRHRREELYPEEEDLQLEDLEQTFDAYIKEATRLKSKYAGQIDLLVGLETEYITPDSLDKLDTLLERYSASISYIVGSVHHINGIPIDFDKATFETALASFPETSGRLSQLDQLFCAYFDAQYQLMQRLRPEVIGHFDLCRLYLPDASFSKEAVWAKVDRNVKYAVEYGALFEVNAAAFRKGWKTAYPAEDVLKLIVSLGGRLILSDDSHGPHAVGLHYTDAHLYLVEQKIQELWYLKSETSGGTESMDVNDRNGGHAGGNDRNAQIVKNARERTQAVVWREDWKDHPFWTTRSHKG